MKQGLIVFLGCCLISLQIKGQQIQYFNETYNNNGFFMKGFSIIDDGDNYVGYGATEDTGVYQNLFFFKIDENGEMVMLKPFIEPYHVYYPGNVGGAMKKTTDGNYFIAYHLDYSGTTYGRLMKMDEDLDTIWTKYYNPEYINVIVNSLQNPDNTFTLIGWAWYEDQDFSDMLFIKTDSLGNFQWHKTYGGNWAEQGANTIQTPDGSYLIGGYFWKT